ncbi:3-deoxy-D-manno-octulosonic acid transferase [Desulfosarcina variabilis]|uniref:3-deoxy-D-manno-octulosonic acid transferase n=1 Tax=Desulfosarcina variabilis TaxID=2300 RepID=UPI003AFAB661
MKQKSNHRLLETSHSTDCCYSPMTIFHYIYAAVPLILSPMVMFGFWCYAKKHPQKRPIVAERLGYDPKKRGQTFRGNPKIWIHAVSVGEVKAAELVIDALDALYPAAAFLLTTTTTTGQHEALRRMGGRAVVCYAPLDLWTVVGRFFSTYQPDVLICMETEIWPNWILKARRVGTKIIFLNGRLSNRSIHSYMKIRPLLKSVLEHVDAFSMISKGDACRIIALGAPSRRVHVNGNVKNDLRVEAQDDDCAARLRELFCVAEDTPVFVGGSVRGTEIEILLDVYERLAARIPGLVFIIAPRHIEKVPMIEQRVRERQIAYQRRTILEENRGNRKAALIILDTIGELRDVYSIASVVFGGASLVPLGGQNVLEAAVWAKPVLFGPHMDDFSEARALLEACGGGICVNNANELTEQAARLLSQPAEAQRMGRLAKAAVLSNQGATDRHVRVVLRLLPTIRPPHL